MSQKQNDSSQSQSQPSQSPSKPQQSEQPARAAAQDRSSDQPQGKDAEQGLPGSALSAASIDKSSSTSGVGRQSGQQREHGHMNAADQARDGAGAAHANDDKGSGRVSDGTDRVAGHRETDAESVSRGKNGGLGKD